VLEDDTAHPAVVLLFPVSILYDADQGTCPPLQSSESSLMWKTTTILWTVAILSCMVVCGLGSTFADSCVCRDTVTPKSPGGRGNAVVFLYSGPKRGILASPLLLAVW